jgi:hypothetical protein
VRVLVVNPLDSDASIFAIFFFTQHCKALLAWLCSPVPIQRRSRTPSQVSYHNDLHQDVFLRSYALTSSRRLYHRRSTCLGGRASKIHHSSRHPGRNRACRRAWAIHSEVTLKLDHRVEITLKTSRERRKGDVWYYILKICDKEKLY